MKTPAVCILTALAAALGVAPANAEPCDCGRACSSQAASGPDWFDRNRAAFYDNLMWPKQYVHPARRGICQSFAIMANNGWRRNNLLGKYDFDPKDEQLTDAGKAKIDWIMTQAPQQRRSIFVERAADAIRTAERIQAVQELASNAPSSAGPVNVQETNLREIPHPAGAVDAVFTGFSTNQLPPVLPKAETGASSGGSSSGQ
jgi:hypothetical protein